MGWLWCEWEKMVIFDGFFLGGFYFLGLLDVNSVFCSTLSVFVWLPPWLMNFFMSSISSKSRVTLGEL